MNRDIQRRSDGEIREVKEMMDDAKSAIERLEILISEAYDAGYKDGHDEGFAQGEKSAQEAA